MNRLLIQKNIVKYILITLFSFLLTTLPLEASILSTMAPNTVSVGERVSVDILVDPQGQEINSIESTIKFDTSVFNFNGFSLKQSSIPIWVEEPKEVKNPPAGGGEVHFSGVIPGGIERLYDPVNKQNTAIPVVRLFFISKRSGTADFTIGESLVLENDGKGTATKVATIGASIIVSPNNKEQDSKSLLAEDVTNPKPFTVSIIERSVFGKTPRLAVFSAEDTDGGIEHYEVAVGNLEFKKAESPFVLPYRFFPYTLTARAYDYSGNFREQQITVGGEKPYGIGAILILAFLCLLAYRYYRKVKKT